VYQRILLALGVLNIIGAVLVWGGGLGHYSEVMHLFGARHQELVEQQVLGPAWPARS